MLALSLLLDTRLPSLCNPALYSQCSSFDFPPFCKDAALALLDCLPSHNLMISTDISVSFSFDKGSSGVFIHCSLYDTEATLSFSTGPIRSSFLLKPARLYKLSADRGNTNKSVIFSLLLLSDSRSVLSSALPLSLWPELSFFLLCYQTTMGPQILASPEEQRD